MTKTPARHTYIPALRFHVLTGLYDALLRMTLDEAGLRRRLVEQARIEPGQRVLDLGCGTGTLALLAKTVVPDADVVGIDADAAALQRARIKAAKEGAAVTFILGLAQEAPLPPGSLDRVLSSLMLHHLNPESKAETLRKAWELLRPGGELHVADWSKAHGIWTRLAFFSVQFLDGFTTTNDHVKGLLPAYFREAGFVEVEETHRAVTLYGTLGFFRAVKAKLGSHLPQAPLDTTLD